MLSFFLDGVPDPDAKPGTVQARGGKPAAGPPTYLHKPYADNNCGACHENTNDIFARAKVRQGICVECHGAALVEYPQMHGPVASGLCSSCHTAHLSQTPHLLRYASPRICTQCHELPTLSEGVAEHRSAAADCLSCHSGHGGVDRKFLLVHSAATTRPAAEGQAPQ
jgi:predicted CXXCH cytochrome family protein